MIYKNYKIGDRVKIQSLEQYNKYKNRYGNINYGDEEDEILFTSEMSSFCGQIATITRVRYIGCVRFYLLAEDNEAHLWVAGMFERLVERNGKTYPYKIGDRVVLKGNNRCATIIDLKYNSWGNLSYYIREDKGKDITDCPTELLLPYDNIIKEFPKDETKPEFKVGDKITNGQVILTILELLSDRYVVEDNLGGCGTLYFSTRDDWKIVEEKTKNLTDVSIPDDPYTVTYDSPTINDSMSKNIICNEIILPEGYIFKDENSNVINATKIVLEKKKEYPKTYKECCEVLVGRKPYPNEISFDKMELCLVDLDDTQSIDFQNPHLVRLNNIFRLLMCRNAYWKIYGEENGLGKPWEADYNDNTTYGLYNDLKCSIINPAQFLFPTEEMRDAFRENFKELIEFC